MPNSVPNPLGGPRTPTGKAITARNATTHGLFSRTVVLPHLGEDPNGYATLFQLLQKHLCPRTAPEMYYVERIAEATWQMRRLARWEAQIWENDDLDEDERLTKLERVQKLQITLGRRVDRAFQMLSRTVSRLTTARVREEFLHARGPHRGRLQTRHLEWPYPGTRGAGAYLQAGLASHGLHAL